LAVLVYDQHDVRPAEIPGFAQFGSKALCLIYSFFRIRKAFPDLIGKAFRAVQDMKKISCHGGSPEYHAKISCGLEIVLTDYAGLSVGLSSRNNHAFSVVKGGTKSRIESGRRCTRPPAHVFRA
jgi:hypothetical protein